MPIPRSSVASIAWPALPTPEAAAMLAMQYQLEQSQWWPPEVLLEQQLRQLSTLLAHAYETIPFYRERLRSVGFDPKSGLTWDMFTSLPLLRRSEVQSAGEALLSQKPLREHGKIAEGKTSGSTGRPIKFYGTQLGRTFWQILTLREHLWHQRDFSGTLAAIRSRAPSLDRRGWGPSTDVAFDTGPCASIDICTDVQRQLKWLQQQNPDYLLSYPSNVRALARACLEQGIKLPRLREVRTLSETLNPDLRALCREAWDVPVVDMYSAAEVGHIALQCPEHEHYHIQSETVLVEILNAEDKPCQPGEIGRVVLTALHNSAMPLIRYEIMDYAEAGARCPCGRGLPVITRILGRQRNLITLPDGRQHCPDTGYKTWFGLAPIQQFQIIQHSLQQIEVKLVMPRPLTQDEQDKMTAILHTSLGHPFDIMFSYHDDIPRSTGGKFEEFMSKVSLPHGAAHPLSQGDQT
ncbi:MAG: phenylacetate--CoA ligase family protein [Gammaproteobacteria bacterium]|nr:phenylacetate--CoA ligase family protein [Gammaproteobacteria bacterium]